MHSKHDSCSCTSNNSAVQQTLDELEFEKSIFNACVQGDIQKVKAMINKHGRSLLNQTDKNGYSCLHYSTRNSHYELSKLLIQNGIDVNLKTSSCQSTALHR